MDRDDAMHGGKLPVGITIQRSAILTVLTMMITMMGISFISYAYQHLFGARMGRQPSETT